MYGWTEREITLHGTLKICHDISLNVANIILGFPNIKTFLITMQPQYEKVDDEIYSKIQTKSD